MTRRKRRLISNTRQVLLVCYYDLEERNLVVALISTKRKLVGYCYTRHTDPSAHSTSYTLYTRSAKI